MTIIEYVFFRMAAGLEAAQALGEDLDNPELYQEYFVKNFLETMAAGLTRYDHKDIEEEVKMQIDSLLSALWDPGPMQA